MVDWCGCSPNDFLSKDISRLKVGGRALWVWLLDCKRKGEKGRDGCEEEMGVASKEKRKGLLAVIR